jgi:hypothetical protein
MRKDLALEDVLSIYIQMKGYDGCSFIRCRSWCTDSYPELNAGVRGPDVHLYMELLFYARTDIGLPRESLITSKDDGFKLDILSSFTSIFGLPCSYIGGNITYGVQL